MSVQGQLTLSTYGVRLTFESGVSLTPYQYVHWRQNWTSGGRWLLVVWRHDQNTTNIRRQVDVRCLLGTCVRTMLWSRTRQPTPVDKILHFLGQSGRVWCGISSCHQELSRLLLRCFKGNGGWLLGPKIGHIVGQLKESWLVVVRCSVILPSRNWWAETYNYRSLRLPL